MSYSGVSHIMNGVPQCSVLGPILFLVFINGIDAIFYRISRVKLFADDLNKYSIVDTSNSTITVHRSLDQLVKWSED